MTSDPLAERCRICNAPAGERCSSIIDASKTLDVPHYTRLRAAKGTS